MRLTLVISSLGTGGAERVMSIMANYWAVKGWKIKLLTFDDGKIPPFYEIDDRICHIPLNIAKNSHNSVIGIWNNLNRIQKLRKAISESKPDAVISFMDKTNVITLIATKGLNISILVSERIDPRMYSIGNIWETLRRWTYPNATRIIVQNQRVLDYFPLQLQERVDIIPNPVLVPVIEEDKLHNSLEHKAIIAMGRFDRQKGFDLLLQAFTKLKDSYPEYTLTILGEGKLRPELESLCNELKIVDRVYLPGRVKNPFQYLKKADIFVMSSRFEGFPNALCEAMACGLPVISTDCPSGPREIIREGVDGILVPSEDVESLAKAMDYLISNETERKKLAARAPEITERFSLEKVMGMWEEIINKAVIQN